MAKRLTENEIRVQCSARCLSVFKESLDNTTLKNLQEKPESIFSICTKSGDQCKTCLATCNHPESAKPNTECFLICKKMNDQAVCTKECEFMKALQTRNCSVESEQNYCFSANQPPIPDSPQSLHLKELSEKLTLSWSTFNLSILKDPVIFLLQVGTIEDPYFDGRQVSRWIDLAMTANRHLELEDMVRETWYQFRVGAFNRDGSRGFSLPTQPFKLPALKPGVPAALREGTTRIHDNLVDVDILWEAPKDMNYLELSKYKITWKLDYGYIGSNENSLVDYTTTVSPEITRYMIRNLQPGKTYLVQVSSVMTYSEKDLASEPSSLYITTPPVPTAKVTEDSTEMDFNLQDSCHCRKINSSFPFTLGKAFIKKWTLKIPLIWKSNGDLQASTIALEWIPTVCIQSGIDPLKKDRNLARIVGQKNRGTLNLQTQSAFIFTDLPFNCQYSLSVTALQSRTSRSWDACFCTPSCHEVTDIRGSTNPRCSTDNIFPNTLTNLRFDLLPTNSTSERSSAQISWLSSNKRNGIKVLNYEITWGPRLYEPIEENMYRMGLQPQIDTELAQTKVLDKNVVKYIIEDLVWGRLYIVKLQSNYNSGYRPVSTVFFTAPNKTSEMEENIKVADVSSRLKSDANLFLLCLCLGISVLYF